MPGESASPKRESLYQRLTNNNARLQAEIKVSLQVDMGSYGLKGDRKT